MKQTTARFEEETLDELSEIAHDERVDRSEVIRRCVNAALDDDAIDIQGPEWASARRKRKRMKKMAQPDWWREGFQQRLRNMVEDLGDEEPPWHPDAVERLLTKWVAYEVEEVLWPDDEDRREWALSVIDDEVETYRQQYDALSDPVPDAQYFEVEDLDHESLDAIEPGDVDLPDMGELVEHAANLMSARSTSRGAVDGASPAEARSKLEARLDVTSSMAAEAVDRALDDDRGDEEQDPDDAAAVEGGVEADD